MATHTTQFSMMQISTAMTTKLDVLSDKILFQILNKKVRGNFVAPNSKNTMIIIET